MPLPAVPRLLLIGAFVITPSLQLKLPKYITPCSRNDPKLNECVVRNGKLAIPKFINGDSKYRVPRLDPLDIAELKVQQGSRALGLSMALKESKVTGLKHAQFLRARTDLKRKHIEWDFYHPFITITGKYEIAGQVLVLPIRGRGTSNITLTNMKTTFTFDYVLEKRGEDGQEYMKVTKTNLDTDIGRAYFKFNNLFNGDRLLSETMHRFVNENWREVVKELGAPVVDSISQVFEIILGRITELVPYDWIYPPE